MGLLFIKGIKHKIASGGAVTKKLFQYAYDQYVLHS